MTLWKEVTVHCPHLRSGVLCLASLRVRYLQKLFRNWNSAQDICLLHLFIYPIIIYSSIDFLDIYFILQDIIQYYFILSFKLFQPWPLRACSAGSWLPLTYPNQCEVPFCLFEALSYFLATRCNSFLKCCP